MPADIATLLAEAPWLARLARSLTSDSAEADDLVQDTYAAALRSPPATDRPLRPWLRRVAINLAQMRHRSRSRRASTESVVETQTEPVRDPEQLLERARLERRLAELVIELDEPFRTTLLLRYREGLSAEGIAKQQGFRPVLCAAGSRPRSIGCAASLLMASTSSCTRYLRRSSPACDRLRHCGGL